MGDLSMLRGDCPSEDTAENRGGYGQLMASCRPWSRSQERPGLRERLRRSGSSWGRRPAGATGQQTSETTQSTPSTSQVPERNPHSKVAGELDTRSDGPLQTRPRPEHGASLQPPPHSFIRGGGHFTLMLCIPQLRGSPGSSLAQVPPSLPYS